MNLGERSRRKSIKEESRILALSLGSRSFFIMVFRKGFLEEFSIVNYSEILSTRDLLDKLSTKDEIGYLINCSGGKYELIIPGVKVIEGFRYLLLKYRYCRKLELVTSCFDNLHLGVSQAICGGETYG